MVGRRMVGDIGEKFLEMGQSLGQQTKKQVIKGIPKAAKKQLMGEKDKDKKSPPDEKQATPRTQKVTEDIEDTGRQHFAQMLGGIKKMTPQQMLAVKQQDAIATQQKAAQVRQHIQRYQQIQQAIQLYRQKKAQEIPAYIAGKPGEAATPEERAKKMEELKKKEKEEKKTKKVILPPSVSRLFGTREKGKIVIG